MQQGIAPAIDTTVKVIKPRVFAFGITIFTSATLLFVVQPIMAKQLIPQFGRAAAVWATCMVFFQCLFSTYFDPRSVVSNFAASFGRDALLVISVGHIDRQRLPAKWILVSTDRVFLKQVEAMRRGVFLWPDSRRIWTDQYSNVLAVIR